MIPLLRLFAIPFASLILLTLGCGLYNTIIPVRLEMGGYSHETIGTIVAAFYVGIFAGSLWVSRPIEKLGHGTAFALFALFSGLLALFQMAWDHPYHWGLIRFLIGICTAGIFVVIESWILLQSPPKMRGVMLSVYLAIFYLALSGGQLLIHLSNPAGMTPFGIIALLSIAAAIPVAMTKSKTEAPLSLPASEPSSRLSLMQLFKISPFGLIGVIISGVLLSSVYGLVPVYARELGASVSEIGNLMALLIFGGLLFQWPLGKIADQTSRRFVLIALSCITVAVSIAVAMVGDMSLGMLCLLLFLFGGCSFSIYPISMAYACEKLEDHQLVAATGGFVLSYGAGAILGPLVAPIAMSYLGSNGLFYFFISLGIFLALTGLKKSTKAA